MKNKRLKLQGRLLMLMQSRRYSPSSREQIARELNLPSHEQQNLKHTLSSMLRKGLAVKGKEGRWKLSQSQRLLEGTLAVFPKGFAICRTDDSNQELRELFIPRRYLNGAIDGDQVVVKMRPTLTGRKSKKVDARDRRRIAEVVAVEKHGKPKIPGLFVNSKNGYVVRPDVSTIEQDINIDGIELDNVAHKDLLDHKVVVLLADPSSRAVPVGRLAGRIVEDLGHKNDPGVDVLSIAGRHQISRGFNAKVESAATSLSKSVSAKEVDSRRDLRDLLTVTIDPENARDFDDAVSVERKQNGDWLLYVHIADVAHYVRPNSEIDQEACERGNSTYLVDRVMPMLPEHLTNEVCSLRPNVDSLTHTAQIRFNPQGEVLDSTTFKSVIHSDARLIYEQVQDCFDGRSGHGIDRGITPTLSLMRKLALVLRRKRVAEGSLDFSMPEVRCVLDERGECVDIVKQGGLEACRVVEEFMLAANRVVAKILYDSEREALYRIHPEPDEQEWSELLAELKVLGVDPLPHKFSDINSALAEMADSGSGHAFSVRILKTMKKAMYSTESTGHFGLGFDYYTHFTSPIRRYPDLIVHRLLRDVESGKQTYRPAPGELEKIARHCTETEIESMHAERESVDVKRISFFRRQLRNGRTGPYKGVVVTIIPKGLLVELDDTLQSGLIPFAELRNDHFNVSQDGLTARGRRTGKIWKVGQTVDVHLLRVDEERGLVDFRL